LEVTVTIDVGCGWIVDVLTGEPGAGGAQLVSTARDVRSIVKSAAWSFQEGPDLPGLLLLEINKSSPFKSTVSMIKSVSPSGHNAETDMKTDMNYG
jgi:hypothetical protein